MPALPPSFLVQARIEIGQVRKWPAKLTWAAENQLTPIPILSNLDRHANEPHAPLEIALGWHASGLLLSINVSDKSHAPQGASGNAASDAMIVCIDTRDTKSIHRAGRFCHRFRITPADRESGRSAEIRQETVPRAREDAPLVDISTKPLCKSRKTGYKMLTSIPAANLNGFDPVDSPRLGFFAKLYDADHGEVALSGDQLIPTEADPSMWSTIELI